MMPKIRNQVEQQIQITHTNLVISNVNHLKEMLINYKMSHLNFHQLCQAFKDFNLPWAIMSYIKEKGVVPDDNMLQLREQMQYNVTTMMKYP